MSMAVRALGPDGDYVYAVAKKTRAWLIPNKLQWYPQQPQRFIFFTAVLGSQALETPQLIFRELNEPELAWLLQPSPEPSPEPC